MDKRVSLSVRYSVIVVLLYIQPVAAAVTIFIDKDINLKTLTYMAVEECILWPVPLFFCVNTHINIVYRYRHEHSIN